MNKRFLAVSMIVTLGMLALECRAEPDLDDAPQPINVSAASISTQSSAPSGTQFGNFNEDGLYRTISGYLQIRPICVPAMTASVVNIPPALRSVPIETIIQDHPAPLVVLLLCSVARSRVLRYMLPAYPAFSILAAIGLLKYVSQQNLRRGLTILTPILGVGVLVLAIHPPVIWHATEIRPIAAAATAATPAGQRYAFHDDGQARYDETNQLQWYGDRYLIVLFSADELQAELRAPHTRVFVLDKHAYQTYVQSQMPNQVLAESGHLLCVRLL